MRDVTRIAGGDPDLWGQIIRANQAAVSEILRDVQVDLDATRRRARRSGDEDALGEILDRGVTGTRAIPGKHGGPAIATASVFVSVPDHPGELARLFADVGEIGVNIEDLHIDHDPGRPVGLVELVVQDTAAECAARPLSRPGNGSPTGKVDACAPCRGSRDSGSPAQCRAAPSWSTRRRGDGRALGIRQVEHLARVSRRAWACATSTPAPSSARSPPGCSTTASTSTDPAAIAAHAGEPELVSGTDPRDPTITVDGDDVAAEIRTQEVTDHVSAVASVPEVRARLLELQRADHRRAAASSSRGATSARWWRPTPR